MGTSVEDQSTSFVFPPYRLDPDERRLSRDREVVSLTPKEFDTLLVLVEAGGRVVGKEELIERVWPDSYVGDGSLARNISVLRKALGEEVIETLPKKGYRISLPVSRVEVARKPAIVERGVEANAERTLLEPAVPTTPAVPWWRRRALVLPVVACALLLVMAFRLIGTNSARTRSADANVAPIRSILIQKEGALDPLDEGFKLARPDGSYTHVIPNADNAGFDRWRLVTDDQNFYYRKLSDAEKQFALQHDWRLTCVCALEKGSGFSDVDLGPGIGPRFDIGFDQEGEKYFVDLTKRISPQYEFDQRVEFKGVADVDHPHTYELRFDHVTQTASLWIDGQERASGYRGHHQYQENYGVMFGVATYRDAKQASVIFREVRFEVN